MVGATGREPPAAGSPDPAAEYWADGALPAAEELTTGRGTQRAALLLQRVPRAARLAGTVLAAGAGLGWLLAGPAHHGPATGAPSSPAAPVVRPRQSVPGILAEALDAAPLTAQPRLRPRPGTCAAVPPTASPARNLVTSVRRALPGFEVRDLSRTPGTSGGLCAMQLRARDGQGVVVLVEVAAPTRPTSRPFDVVNIQVTSDGTTASSIATTLTRSGWSVTVAAVGPVADQPSSAAMFALAGDASLIW